MTAAPLLITMPSGEEEEVGKEEKDRARTPPPKKKNYSDQVIGWNPD